MNAYHFKELRETARWLPLAWLIFAGLLYVALPQMSNLYLTQGLADRLVFQTAIGGSLVAFGLGLAQFHIGWLVGALVLQIAIAMILAYLAAQQRGLSARSRTLWLILSALLGPASSLAILAIYPECFREPCPRCDKRRRVENELCEHCGKAWDKPADEGIEIIETSSNAINEAVLA